MTSITQLFCLGIPSSETKIQLNFKKDKNVVFLTGHNGIGKTKLLKAIHQNICLAQENNSFDKANVFQNYLMSMVINGNWETILQHDISGYNDNYIKKIMSFNETLNNANKEKVWKTCVEKLNIEYSTIMESKEFDKEVFSKIYSEDKRQLIMKGSKINSKAVTPNSLFFSYDTVHYSGNKDDSPDSRTLDHHLQLALERFKNLPSEEGIDSDSIKIILENQFKKSNIKIDEKVKNTLLTNLQENLGNRALPTQKILDTLNIFFNETSREIIQDKEEVIKCKLANSDEAISWRDLSKGEKSLIFLCFSVYFYSKDNVVFLIDEPEISLHISRQEKLIKHLLELSPKSQFIIATHAPSIIFKTEKEQYFNLENFG